LNNLSAVITAALFVSVSAHAGPFAYANESYCQALASMATAITRDRDAGSSLEAAHDDIATAEKFGGEVITDFHNIAENVFKYPRLTPSEEGNRVYFRCVGEYS